MEQPYLYYITWGEGGSPTPSILPVELQACEYLQGDGNSGIKLDMVNQNSINSIELEYMGNGIFSSRSNTGTFLQVSQNNYYAGARYYTNQNMIASQVDITQNWCKFSINDIENKYNFNSEQHNNPNSINKNVGNYLVLFGTNYGTIAYYNGTKLKYIKTNLFEMYACYIKAGETFVNQYGNVCQAGTPGMYDVVNNIFYTNDGTGAFTVGPDIIL